MIGVEDIEALVRDLDIPTSVDMDRRVLAVGLAAYEKSIKTKSALTRPNLYTLITRSKMARLAVVTAVIIVFLWGIIDWPSSGPKNGRWWLGSPAAWSQEIIDSLDQVQALIYWQSALTVYGDGHPEILSGLEKRYIAKGMYRTDRYDDGINITKTTWIVHDGKTWRKYEVCFELKSYFEEEMTHPGFSYENQLESLRSKVYLLSQANRMVGVEVIDGRECVGFEIDAGDHVDNPEGWFTRVWIDIETKLPAQIEEHRQQGPFNEGCREVTIHDRFEYFTEVPLDMFEPKPPAGFVRVPPLFHETIRQKPLIDVPEGLADEMVAALKDVNTGIYEITAESGYSLALKYMYFSKNAVRKDYYLGDKLWVSHLVIQGYDASLREPWGEPYWDVGKWALDYDANVAKVLDAYQKESRPILPIEDFIVGFADRCCRAHRFVEYAVIDGIECFGFEYTIKGIRDEAENPVLKRLWFDIETKLPVRIETVIPGDGKLKQPHTIWGRFQWNVELPADTFDPVPEGFTRKTPTGYVRYSGEPEGKSRFSATLPNGVTVELFGVCGWPVGGRRCWRPDGSAISKEYYASKWNQKPGPDKYGFMVHVQGPEDPHLRWLRISASKGSEGSCNVMDVAGNKVIDCTATIANIRQRRQTTNLVFGVANGPWKTIASYDGKEMLGAEDAQWSEASEDERRYVHIGVATEGDLNVQRRIVAIDNAGNLHKPVGYGRSFGKIDRSRATFKDLTLREIKQFQHQTRRYEWVEFKNVSVKPNLKTDVQIELVEP